MGFGFKQPLVGEKRCVTTQITAAKETTHTIVQAVPAFKYERGYLIGYFETRDPRMFFQDVTQSRTVI